jgi:predicted phosphoadenosine phosphosulfate sulfurtransferase
MSKAISKFKIPIGINVLEATKERINKVFDEFDFISVSFSGGKDSTVLLHTVMEIAIVRKKKIALLFIDWEAQFDLTIKHVKDMFDFYKDHIDPYWVAIPLRTVNALSMIEPEWTCWDLAKKDAWVRELPQEAITNPFTFPFYTYNMTFEEFVPAFGKWYANGHLTAMLVGIRCNESLNRFRAIARNKSKFKDWKWSTYLSNGCVYNIYPIYDWSTEDVWIYHAKTNKPYNQLYDRMHQAGLTIHQMRICEPYGDEQRKGLWLYHIIEPETWGKVAARVAGANSGSLYSKENGSILGNYHISKPKHFTWQQFAKFLLATMPPTTSEHYENKIVVYINYCYTHYFDTYRDGLPDETEGDMGSKDVPSWRHICKVLLSNDYWCKGLSFSPTNTSNYAKYKKMVNKRKKQWGIYI